MKKFLKNNLVVIICFLVLFTLASIGLYKEFRERNNNYKMAEKNIENCKSAEYKTPEYEAYCKNLLENGYQKFGFFDVLGDLVSWQLSETNLGTISVIGLLIPCIYELTKLKKKIPYNYMIREDYQKYQRRVFKSGYKYLWLIPSILIFLIVAVSIFTNFNFTSVDSLWKIDSVKNVALFLGCYILQTILISGLYINIVLSVTRKYKNFFIALIISALAILGTELILEIGVGGILFDKIFHMGSFSYLFNIMDIYLLNDSMGILPRIIFLLGIYIVSLIPVYLLYKNKEKYVLDCER